MVGEVVGVESKRCLASRNIYLSRATSGGKVKVDEGESALSCVRVYNIHLFMSE